MNLEEITKELADLKLKVEEQGRLIQYLQNENMFKLKEKVDALNVPIRRYPYFKLSDY